MDSISAKEVAMRLEHLYTTKIASHPKYQDIRIDCHRWFDNAFEDQKEFETQYLMTDYAFVNILACCMENERRMSDILCICNPWALWHFDLTICESIRKLKLEKTNALYLAPASDSQFLKKYALSFR